MQRSYASGGMVLAKVVPRPEPQLGMVADYNPRALFTIQFNPYIYLAQNCIRLEPGLFKAALRLSRLKFRTFIATPGEYAKEP